MPQGWPKGAAVAWDFSRGQPIEQYSLDYAFNAMLSHFAQLYEIEYIRINHCVIWGLLIVAVFSMFIFDILLSPGLRQFQLGNHIS